MSKADDVFWRQFGVVLILLTVFGFAMYFVANSIAGRAYAKMNDDPDAVLARIAPVGESRVGDPAAQTQAPAPTQAVGGASTTAAAPAMQAAEPTSETTGTAAAAGASDAGSGEQMAAASAGGALDLAAGEQIYQAACFACHLSGVANAPKLDDPAAWEPRLAQGMAGLLQSSVNGKGAMPPKGGFAHLTEDDLRNAIGFMLDKAGVSAGG